MAVPSFFFPFFFLETEKHLTKKSYFRILRLTRGFYRISCVLYLFLLHQKVLWWDSASLIRDNELKWKQTFIVKVSCRVFNHQADWIPEKHAGIFSNHKVKGWLHNILGGGVIQQCNVIFMVLNYSQDECSMIISEYEEFK